MNADMSPSHRSAQRLLRSEKQKRRNRIIKELLLEILLVAIACAFIVKGAQGIAQRDAGIRSDPVYRETIIRKMVNA